jgi:cytochrome c oxidase assembly protein subunit 15
VNSKPQENVGLRRFAVFTACLTFVLVWMGGLVTSKGVGLSVPDWPNTYGYNMFFFPPSKWIGGIFFEHTHRLVASTVGFLTMLLALWLYGRNSRPVLRWGGILFVIAGMLCCVKFPKHDPENISTCVLGAAFFAASFVWPKCEPSPRWMRVLGVCAFIAVVAQGVLGGLRVTELDARIGIFHATLAQLFLVLVSFIALSLTTFWRNLPFHAESDRHHIRFFFAATTLLVLAQLVLGATMRHQHAGLSIPDFPLAYGKIWPDTSAAAISRYNAERINIVDYNPITALQVELQMLHRIGALLILIAVAYIAWRTPRYLGRQHRLGKLAFLWLALVLTQALLGAATIWTGKAADIATAHVACGALCLVTGGLTSILSFKLLAAPVAQRADVQKNELTSWVASSSISQ